MAVHAPKYLALEAYAEKRLSPAGAQRMERHLEGCSGCREALSAVGRYATLRQDVQAEPVPELSWERLAAALDQPQQAQSLEARAAAGVVRADSRPHAGKVIALAWPVLALAATFLLGFMALSESRERAARVVPRTAPPVIVAPAEEEAFSEGWVTLAAGEAELEAEGRRAAARPGLAVREGASLRTGKQAEVHVALVGETGIVLEGESEFQVTRLRVRSLELTLRRGRVFQQVKKLAANERFEVAFGPYVARVRGTRFRVQHMDTSSVSVFEGRVVVYEGDKVVADLSAGQSWQSKPVPDAVASHDRLVHGAVAASETWATLEIPSAPGVAEWRIDGSSLAALGGLSMRVPAGDLTLAFKDLRGLERSLSLRVAPEGSVLGETTIRELLAAQNEPSGSLDPEQIEPVVRGGLDLLRRCYERGLKRDPKLVGKLVLSIRVAPDGHVARANLRSSEGTDLPLDVETCIQTEARAWRFPRPSGGSVVFEVPLNLKSTR
jgi:hypothetical protein